MSRPPKLPFATPEELGLPGRPASDAYEVTDISRFDSVHLEVTGKRYGRTTACGEYFGSEGSDALNGARISGYDGYGKFRPVTCVKCLAAAQLRIVRAP